MPNFRLPLESLEQFRLDSTKGFLSDLYQTELSSQPVLIIGLGGIGLNTVSALKKELLRSSGQITENIQFLAIDSDNADISRHLSDGILTANEIINLDVQITPFYNSPVTRTKTHETLAFSHNYHRCCNTIMEKIHIATHHTLPQYKLNIIIVSGISGYTGSSLLIDLPYIIRQNLNSYTPIADFKISAYCYTPDVHYNYARPYMSINAYATMKELDHFMNIENTNEVYKWSFYGADNSACYSMNWNIFDFCTLISGSSNGNRPENPEEYAIDFAVRNLLCLLHKSEFENNGVSLPLSYTLTDRAKNLVSSWKSHGNGLNEARFPENANYCYNIFGYSQMLIPYKEAMSYAAFNIIDEIIKSEQKDIDYKQISSSILMQLPFSSPQYLANTVKYNFYIRFHEEAPRGFEIRMLKDSYKLWRDKAINYCLNFEHSPQLMEAIDRNAGEILNKLDSLLKQLLAQEGAMVCKEIIDGTNPCCLRKTINDFLLHAIPHELSKRKYEFKNLHNTLDKRATEIHGFMTMVPESEREDFIAFALNLIDYVTVDVTILERISYILKIRINDLFDKYVAMCDLYEQTLTSLRDTFKYNFQPLLCSVMNSENTDSALMLDSSMNGTNLKQYIDNTLITPLYALRLKEKLNFEFFELENPEEADLFEIINHLFEHEFSTHFRDSLSPEKLLIVHYSDYTDFSELKKDIKDEGICRRLLLDNVITQIYQRLLYLNNPQYNNSYSKAEFEHLPVCISVPEYLYDIFNDYFTCMPSGVHLYKGTNSLCIDMIINYQGIPFNSLREIRQYHIAYNQAMANGIEGLHLDSEKYPTFPDVFIQEI